MREQIEEKFRLQTPEMDFRALNVFELGIRIKWNGDLIAYPPQFMKIIMN